MSGKTIFITGASGFIGSAVTRAAVAQGYKVRGLSRSESSDEKIKSLGGIPVRGDLASLDLLRREAANADVIANLGDAFVGSRFAIPYLDSVKITNAAVDAMAEAIEGTNKSLVTANGARIALADPSGRETTEDGPDDPDSFFDRRLPSEHALAWAKRGVHVTVIRIAPFVHGHGGSIDYLLEMAKTAGAAVAIDGGKICTSSVHVDDVGRLFILAAEKSAAGESYNGVSETSVTFADFMGEVAAAVDVPVKHMTLEEATTQLGPLFADYLNSPCRASSEKAKRVLGWEPKEMGLLRDIRSGSYEAVKAKLRKPASA